METAKHVIYIQGRGREPEVQATFAQEWQQKHKLQVVHERINWRGDDYEDRIATIGGRIVELSNQGSVSVLAASAGGKAALSLFAHYTDSIHRVVLINSKIPPYDPSAVWLDAYPNILKSSNLLPSELEKITPDMRARILCVRSETDEEIEPDTSVLVLSYAHTYDMQNVHGHKEGIAFALTEGSQRLAEFIHQEEPETVSTV